jgi:hypothetical protein
MDHETHLYSVSHFVLSCYINDVGNLYGGGEMRFQVSGKPHLTKLEGNTGFWLPNLASESSTP